jgi:flagellar motor switch protein FliN/FliY
MQETPAGEHQNHLEAAADSDLGTTAPERGNSPAPAASPGEGEKPQVRSPEFAPLIESRVERSPTGVDRFYDVNVPVWAELGRIEMPLGELLKLDEGVVLRLDRPVSEPVDLVSQGVKLARGEVVVIEDCFAIRIKEIERSK